jgi:hypothetical protein
MAFMSLLHEVLGAPATEAIDEPVARDDAEPGAPERIAVSNVKRLRIGQYGGRLLLGLNAPAARDLMSTPAFWYHMDAVGQIPIFLREHEIIPGYFSKSQAVLMPKLIEGERGPDLTDQQITDFARMCVEGKIVRRWAVPSEEAAQNGVIVFDNRRALPDDEFYPGPLNSDVIATSNVHYQPRHADTAA